MLKESFRMFTPSKSYSPFFLELYQGAQRYTVPQSLYKLKPQLGQQLAHAQMFDCGVHKDSTVLQKFIPPPPKYNLSLTIIFSKYLQPWSTCKEKRQGGGVKSAKYGVLVQVNPDNFLDNNC